VAVDMEGHGALKLTEESRPILRGERALRLRRDPVRGRNSAKEAGARSARPRTPLDLPNDPEALELWERLRACRRELAQSQGVPPYVVFADSTLKELVCYRPRTLDELGSISGVGAAKLERYGEGFLGILVEHESEHGRPSNLPPLPERRAPTAAPTRGGPWDAGLTETVRETLTLCRAGFPAEAIAERRGVKLDTVYTHLARCIEEGELKLREAVSLSDPEIGAIEWALGLVPPASPFALRPVYESFQGQYPYGVLRCVRAAMGEGQPKLPV
jgi:ATP-dependent DNA helicase RecQ